MNVFYYFLKEHRLVNLISLMLIFLGFMALKSTHVDLVPPFDFKGVRITINYPEATAGDMEEYVVFPIEEQLADYPDIKSITSVSENGKASLRLRFPADYSRVPVALSEVKEIVEELRPRLPAGIRNITLKETKVNRTFQNWIVIKGADLEKEQHENLLKGLKNKISAIKGISEVYDSRPKKKLAIDFKESLLKEKELLIKEALIKLREHLKYVPLGSISKGTNKTIFEFKKPIGDEVLEKVKNVPIKSNALGYQTLLKDVAQVSRGFMDVDYKTYHDYKESYSFRVLKDLNSDVLVLDRKVREVLKKFNASQKDITAVSTISAKGFISRQLRALKSNGFFGLVLVSLLLVFFLSFRAALCAVWGVPIAYAGTFLLIYLLGLSINLLSVVGLIIVAGILVDDALIVTEKYNELLEEGEAPTHAAQKAIKELFVPVLGTALTTVVAFLPLILIPSEMGMILVSIPIIVIGSLGFSIFESFFILPSHLVSFNKKVVRKALTEKVFGKCKEAYAHYLNFSLKHRYLTCLGLFVFSVVSVYWSMDLEKNFNLNIGDEVVTVSGKLKSSPTKEQTLKEVSPIYEHIKKTAQIDGVVDVNVRVGSIWSRGEVTRGENVFLISAYVNENLSNPEPIKKKLEKNFKAFVDRFKEENDIFEYINVQKKFSGDEEAENGKYLSFDFYTKTTNLSLNLKNIFKDYKIQGVGDLEVGSDAKKIKKWVFEPNEVRMAELGVDKAQIQNAVLGRVQDVWVQDMRVNGENVSVTASLDSDKVDKEKFTPQDKTLITSTGARVSLSDLGAWSLERAAEKINHSDGYKVQSVKFPIVDPKKRDEIVKNSKSVVERLSQKYPQYIIRSSGQSLQEKENRDWVLKSLVSCLIGIYFVLILVLGSFTQPFIVSLPIVFGVVGVMIAHKAHGMPLGVLAGVGLIGAIGVSVNGSLVMATQINKRILESTDSILDSIKRGALSRFRAILLTSLTTLGGLFPMAYGIGGDAGFTKGLAFSMAWGVMLSSVLTVFFFPAVYASLKDLTSFTVKIFQKKAI